MSNPLSDPLNALGENDENDFSFPSDEAPKFKDPILTPGLDSDDAELESLDLDASIRSEMNVSRSSSLIAAFRLDDDMDLETRDLFVIVDNPEKHTSAMESYITFRISTRTTRSEFDNHEYCVRRRYNDFLWLRQRLEEAHPTHLVAPLPEKHSLRRLDRFTPDFIKIRATALQKFLTRIQDHPVISFNKHLQVFLTAKAWEFQAHKKQGSGLISRVADSIHSISAAYMVKNRTEEFDTMHEYIQTFNEKLGVLDRISQRIIKEQADYFSELCDWGPMYTLWSNSEEQLSRPLLIMSHTLDKCAAALKDLIETTEENFSQPLKEYMLYADAARTVLRRRDTIQMEYELTAEELTKRKGEKENLKTSDQTYSFGAFLGKDPEDVKQQKEDKLDIIVDDLTRQMEKLNDKNVCANADLRADMDRWHKTRRKDLRDIFLDMCDRQIKYYENCLVAWEDSIHAIQAQDKKPEIIPTAVDSGHGSID